MLVQRLMFGKGNKSKDRKRRKRRLTTQERKMRKTAATMENLVTEEVELAGEPSLQVGPKPRRKMVSSEWAGATRFVLGWFALWGMVTAAGILYRNPWPMEETRFLAVAWEMWLSQNYLAPTLNNVAYTGSPPLLFWLTNLGWQFLGAVEWWPRLMMSLFSLGTLVLVYILARNLWPGKKEVARYAPLIMLSLFAWATYTPILFPDTALVFFITMAMTSLVLMANVGVLFGALLLTFALAAGSLTSGLVIFWVVLPAAYLAPAWVPQENPVDAGKWYVTVSMAFLTAIGVFAAWFMPMVEGWEMARIGSTLLSYSLPQLHDVFGGLTPMMGFLILIPILLLPWSIWPLTWIRLWRIRQDHTDKGIMFCLAWAFPVLITLILISIRQPHFLLIIFPPYALVLTFLMLDDKLVSQGEGGIMASMGLPLTIVGGLLAMLPKLPMVSFLPGFLWQLPVWMGISVAALGMAISFLPSVKIRQNVMNIVLASIALATFTQIGVGLRFNEDYDVSEMATTLSEIQQSGRKIAFIGEYHGQFQYAGKLKPIEVVALNEVFSWAGYYPDGVFITLQADISDRRGRPVAPMGTGSYLGKTIYLLEAKSITR